MKKEGKKNEHAITPEQLDSMMPVGEKVHTFMQAGPCLVGADWPRSKILKAAKRRAEISGKAATEMGHGAVIWNEYNIPVFVETKKENSNGS